MSAEVQAALRVGEWLHEFDHLRGLDREVIHTANYSPLLASDLRLLIAQYADEIDSSGEAVAAADDAPSAASTKESP